MITETNDTVKIDIEEEDLLKACAFFENFKDWCKNDQKDTTGIMVRHLTTATEVMQAFWIEHFGND